MDTVNKKCMNVKNCWFDFTTGNKKHFSGKFNFDQIRTLANNKISTIGRVVMKNARIFLLVFTLGKHLLHAKVEHFKNLGKKITLVKKGTRRERSKGFPLFPWCHL